MAHILQKTIFITISRGSLIRNFFHTGVIAKLLDDDLRVVILTPYFNDPKLFKDFEHKNLFFEPLFWSQKEKLRGILNELSKGAVFNSTVHARYRYSIGTPQKPNRLLYPPRMLFFAPLRHIPGIKWVIKFFYSLINPLKAHDYLFEKYKPDLVFNTASSADCGVLRSAKRFNVRAVDMPKSWDNLSQALFKTKADFLIVWSDFMRDQAIKLQGYKESEIIVAGVPQFDFYARKDGLLSREEFCKKQGLNPSKKIILYSSAGGAFCNEIDYVMLIKKYIDEGKIKDAQILVRPHLGYAGDAKRFDYLSKYDNIVVDTTDVQNMKLRDNWDSSWNHVVNLFNSLYHADVCVNAASTLSLDAVACGTEVVNIGFDIEYVSDFNKSAKRLYLDDYIRKLMDSGGTWLVKNEEDFQKTLKSILQDGDKKEKKQTIDKFIYKTDGKSAERIANALTRIVNQT